MNDDEVTFMQSMQTKLWGGSLKPGPDRREIFFWSHFWLRKYFVFIISRAPRNKIEFFSAKFTRIANMKRFVSCNEESLTLLCGKDRSFKDYLDDEVRCIDLYPYPYSSFYWIGDKQLFAIITHRSIYGKRKLTRYCWMALILHF